LGSCSAKKRCGALGYFSSEFIVLQRGALFSRRGPARGALKSASRAFVSSFVDIVAISFIQQTYNKGDVITVCLGKAKSLGFL